MIENSRRRRRLGRLAGMLVGGVLAVGAVSLGATAGSAGAAAAPASTAHGTASAAGAAAPARSRVPWSKVGPGWVLAEYSAGPMGEAAPVTLYLISPVGVRYPMHTWTDILAVPELLSWPGDKTRVLLLLNESQYEQLTLSTGKFTVVRLAGQAQPTGYTPDGQNILGVAGGTVPTIARYSLTGKLLTVLTRGVDENTAVYAANGTVLAVSGANGLELVSNGGRLIRSLPVPGTDPTSGCTPLHWWNPTAVLAQCVGKGGVYAPRLWLVPTDGKRPVAEIPQPDQPGVYFGDSDAWQLPSGPYVQAIGRCATPLIFREAANGSLTPVVPPHTAGLTNEILTALGPQLLIETDYGCPAGTSLMWFNPGTQAEQWLLRAPVSTDGVGVIDALAYSSPENG
jgi:hypothetical protein